MMLPPTLDTELASLRQVYVVDVAEEASVVNLVFRDFPTSELYNRPTTNLLLRVPRSYPDAGLDMFWTDIELLLQDGTVPANAQQIERYSAVETIPGFAGKQWRRFSWHPQFQGSGRWNPALDNIESYLEFVRKRMRQR